MHDRLDRIKVHSHGDAFAQHLGNFFKPTALGHRQCRFARVVLHQRVCAMPEQQVHEVSVALAAGVDQQRVAFRVGQINLLPLLWVIEHAAHELALEHDCVFKSFCVDDF